MGACARNMQSDSAEIKPAQCCIKLVFHLTYQYHYTHYKVATKYIQRSRIVCFRNRDTEVNECVCHVILYSHFMTGYVCQLNTNSTFQLMTLCLQIPSGNFDQRYLTKLHNQFWFIEVINNCQTIHVFICMSSVT